MRALIPDLRRVCRAAGLAVAVLAGGAKSADAHPHIWVNVTGEARYAADGTITNLRETWRFDEVYTAFAIQGLKLGNGSELGSDNLAPLLADAVAALKENGAFTHLRADGLAVAPGEPVEPSFSLQDGELVLRFTLPLQAPLRARTLTLEIYDPTWFVDFELTSPEPLALIGAPAGCKAVVAKANNPDQAAAQQRSEAFFISLAAISNFGAQFARPIAVACP
jgi:ABC-type uncharacterized transport system substrate-binding protein